MLTPEEQEAFLESTDKVRQAAEHHLRTHPGLQSVVAFVANLQRGVSRVAQTAVDQGAKLACKVGCNHCCGARVEAMAPEVLRIVEEVEAWPIAERERLVRRLQTHAALLGGEGEWQRAKCPFLADELCSIYEIRPSVCRRAHSLDVTKCQEHSPEIPQNLQIVVAAEALMKGTAAAYGNLRFDASGHELGHAVLLALTDPSAEARWYSGEDVFARHVIDLD